MMNRHLTEEEIQQYAENASQIPDAVSAHIHNCEECETQVEMYKSMFSGISQIAPETFDFNLEAAVFGEISKTYEAVPGFRFLTTLAVIASCGLGAVCKTIH